MRFVSVMGTVVSIGMVSALAACGGGGGGDEPPDTLAEPNSVVVIENGNSSVQKSTYALDPADAAAFEGASGVSSLGNLVLVYTETDAFDAVLIYSSTDSRKYITGLLDTSQKSYGCRSRAFTNTELQALADQLEDPVVLSLPVCNKTVAINHAGRQASYANLKLPADNGTPYSITLSANFSWPVPMSGI
jgi:hypothetical protein